MSKPDGKTEEEILEFLRDIGQLESPAKDYADLKEKDNFNIEKYPLKVAFNFAWEGLARAKYHPEAVFPTEICKQYLKNHFKITEDNKDFVMYAKLLELNAVLSTLEKAKPTDEKKFSVAQKIIGRNRMGKSWEK